MNYLCEGRYFVSQLPVVNFCRCFVLWAVDCVAYVNSMILPTGSGSLQLSDKVMTLYKVLIFFTLYIGQTDRCSQIRFMELIHAVRHKKETSSSGTRYLDSIHQRHNRNISNQKKGIMLEYGGEMSH
jgi:hypothetical protein